MTDIEELTEDDLHAATAELLDGMDDKLTLEQRYERDMRVISKWAADTSRWQDELNGLVSTAINELAELKRKPPRPHRTGAGARVNPDDIRVFYGVLAGAILLPLFTFAASFNFQMAFGAYTPLDSAWWWVIPCILELPLIVLTPMVLIFQRRRESVVGPWATMIALTLAAGAINFSHSATEQGLDTVTDWLVAAFIGSWPLLTLVLFKFFARLAVKPERPETPAPAPAARRTPKKGTKR